LWVKFIPLIFSSKFRFREKKSRFNGPKQLEKKKSLSILVNKVQWNHSIKDTLGPEKCCPQLSGVLITEVKLNRNLQIGTERLMSLIERCPQREVPLYLAKKLLPS
jgi:hypothetical protein